MQKIQYYYYIFVHEVYRYMKNILYVEDDDILSFLIKDQLENQGYKVSLENSPEAALEQLLQDHFDWIILDIDLSTSISGLDLAEKIRSAGIETPIVFTTGDSRDETLVRIFGLSNCDYIKKSFELPELIFRLHRFSNQENTCKKIIHFGPYKLYPNERIIEMGSSQHKLNNQQYHTPTPKNTQSIKFQRSDWVLPSFRRTSERPHKLKTALKVSHNF